MSTRACTHTHTREQCVCCILRLDRPQAKTSCTLRNNRRPKQTRLQHFVHVLLDASLPLAVPHHQPHSHLDVCGGGMRSEHEAQHKGAKHTCWSTRKPAAAVPCLTSHTHPFPPALLTASSAMAQITVAIVTIITLAEPNHGLVELVVLP